MKEILKLCNISLIYHTDESEIPAIKNVSFSVEDGEFISVIGPSGCGKTSILSIIAGLIKQSQGKIYLGGEEIVKPSKHIGYMLQKDELFPWLTIGDNILLPLKIKKMNTPANRNYTDLLLKKYGLYEFKNRYPHELSGGMRQRAALIRTLASSPDLLLLDEPFSALDYQTRLAVCDDVYKIINTEKKTAVLVTHDISEAISMSDRIIVLSKRPATVYNMHSVSIDKSLSPLKRREDPDFRKWFERLWRELDENKS